MVEHFHFIRPLWLLGLIPLFFILWNFYNSPSRHNSWDSICDAHLLPTLTNQKDGYPTFLNTLILFGLAWVLCIIALAGPTWKKMDLPNFRANLNQVFILDVSQNMLESDIKPSRLVRAKYKIRDILSHSKDMQNALVVFTAEPFTVIPLTEDINTIENLLPQLDLSIMPVLGHDTDAALKFAEELVPEEETQFTKFILITANKVSQDAIAFAKSLRKKGIRVSVLDLQSKTQYNTSLRNLASAGGGIYAPFTDDENDIQSIISNIKTHGFSLHSQQTNFLSNRWLDQGKVFVWLLLPFALLAFRRGWFERITNL